MLGIEQIYMYDIFFISYDELNADQNWSTLTRRFPKAKRVHGVKGINNAHAACADQSLTRMFWTIDGDTVVDDTFDFSYAVMPWDTKYLHVWYSRNPVNGLEYGYGAVKLWPGVVAKHKTENWLDFTTTVGRIKIVDDIVSTTHFNTDSYNAWKSGFRESVKLCANIFHNNNSESIERLLTWLNIYNNVPHALDTITGARDAIKFVTDAMFNIDQLKLINDFDWLKNRFQQSKIIDADFNKIGSEVLQHMIGYKNV